MSHTKGKLRFDGPEVYRVEDGTQVCFIEPVFPIEDCKDDAHRLVACWNALDGVPTEWIENYVAGGAKNLLQENAALKAEVSRLNSALMRDAISEIQNVERVEVFPVYAKDEKLRKAAEEAERLISYWRGYAPPILQPEELQVIENLRAALNKVES